MKASTLEVQSRLKNYVSRIQHADYGPESLQQLLMGLRKRTFGCRAIDEISDLVAHPFEREKGIAFEFGKRLALSAAATQEILRSQGTWPPSPLPEYYAPLGEARLELYWSEEFKDKIGCSKSEAQRHLRRIREKLKKSRIPEPINVSATMHLANAENAPTDSGRDRPEIEVTPAMIEAGVRVVSSSGAALSLWDGGQSLSEDLFLAMARAGGYSAWLA